jgi:plastocyanin
MKRRNIIAAMSVAVLCAGFSYSLAFGSSPSAHHINHTRSAASKVVKVKVGTNSSGVFFFSPKKVSIKVGSSVLWSNPGTTAHTVTSLTNKFKSRSLLGKGHVEISFKKAGTYKYHCIFHASMTGEVIVHK